MRENQSFCEALLHAESEAEVIDLLRTRGYWDDPALWRPYGDTEGNWSQGGNQQGLPEAALVEKVVNAIDARLINECRQQEIDPEGPDAPKTIRQAVARFFDNSKGDKMATGGNIDDWERQKIREVAKGITLTATGPSLKALNITISDCGEGQSPMALPSTILSLGKSNKVKIPFVQGQFNQGGTGALRFCGDHSLQLVMSRRNPALLGLGASARDKEWGFTIVRRERPNSDAPGERKNSVYTYLAPVGVSPGVKERRGGVLSFAADAFPIFPNNETPYGRGVKYGTAIKMFDYGLSNRSHILLKQGLMRRLEILLPKIALPIRLYEYRKDKTGKYRREGRSSSPSGLLRRLKDNDNVENGFPISLLFQVKGERLSANVYAFVRRGDDNMSTARSYRKDEGVAFVLNGQTQGILSKAFFRRDAVKMKPLADELLVFVDCDALSPSMREELFMTSRDRLAKTDFKQALEKKLESALCDCQELKDLRSRRQNERQQKRFEDDKPLVDGLQSLIKRDSNLHKVLTMGLRISNPFKTEPIGVNKKANYQGKYYPTYFRIKGVPDWEPLRRPCPINNPMRLSFETDACNDYFDRHEVGFSIEYQGSNGTMERADILGPNLNNGIASVKLYLPSSAQVGETIEFIARTHDESQDFANTIEVEILPKAAKPPSGGRGRKPKHPSGLDLPKITPVYREDWKSEGFDEYTAMTIETLDYAPDGSEIREFKINVDNIHLRNEAKSKPSSEQSIATLRKQFIYANALIGMGMLQDHLEDKSSNKAPRHDKDADATKNEDAADIEERIAHTCRALALFIPTLISLGAHSLDDNDGLEGLEDSV